MHKKFRLILEFSVFSFHMSWPLNMTTLKLFDLRKWTSLQKEQYPPKYRHSGKSQDSTIFLNYKMIYKSQVDWSIILTTKVKSVLFGRVNFWEWKKIIKKALEIHRSRIKQENLLIIWKQKEHEAMKAKGLRDDGWMISDIEICLGILRLK